MLIPLSMSCASGWPTRSAPSARHVVIPVRTWHSRPQLREKLPQTVECLSILNELRLAQDMSGHFPMEVVRNLGGLAARLPQLRELELEALDAPALRAIVRRPAAAAGFWGGVARALLGSPSYSTLAIAASGLAWMDCPHQPRLHPGWPSVFFLVVHGKTHTQCPHRARYRRRSMP